MVTFASMFEKPHYEELTTPAVDVLRGTLL